MKAKIVFIGLLAAPLLGFVAEKTVSFEPDSALWIDGNSTVRSFKCTAKKLDAVLGIVPDSELPTLVANATVKIPIATLDCANGTMNSHMRKALKAESNPDIAFKLVSYTINGAEALLKGDLTIAGETRYVDLPAIVIEESTGVVRVKAAKPINMKEWGVKPPSLMMGTMKVKDVVTVNFDVSVKR